MPFPTHTLLTSGSSITDGASFPTASVTPTADALVWVGTISQGFNQPDDIAPNSVAGAGLTFELAAAPVRLASFGMLSVWRAMSSSPSSGAITIGFPLTQDAVAWAVGEWTGVLSGNNGANALGPGAPRSNPAAARIGPTLQPIFTHPENSCFALNGWADVDTGTNAVATPGTGFTEIIEVGAQEVGFGCVLQVQFQNANAPSSVAWSILDFAGGLAFEVRANLPLSRIGTVKIPLKNSSRFLRPSYNGASELVKTSTWF